MTKAEYVIELLEKWNKETVVNPAEKGEHTNKTVKQLKKELKQPGADKRELNFAIRAKTGWGKVNK